ncbi:hypothetical protein IHV25_06510 [Phaeovibrio sulfidiphilus]|uniref:Uncharacterized protein n=1 Tax=Phaeovibrio sulfidiphilus TaxID=1220600 RepID=A0A8J6YJ67_9PROT|nr:hypothetical protein [Phaeovibrio sulfidiphilus]MBE1237296.1 hypothetical protein [Phaeovibrio sulfidiphilus]
MNAKFIAKSTFLLFLGLLLFLAGALYGSWIVLNPKPFVYQPGDHLAEFGQEDTMVVAISDESLNLTAQRSVPNDPFSVLITYSNGDAPRRCRVNPDLSGLLDSLTLIVARKNVELDLFQTDYPVFLGYLELKKEAVDLFSPLYTLRRSPDGRVALQTFTSVAEIEIPAETFERLKTLCGPRPPGAPR